MNNGSRSSAVLLALIALVAAGCGSTEKEPPKEGGDDTTSVSSGYRQMDVRDGGRITGRVVLAGTPPKLEEFAIGADQSICAPASPNNRLQLGGGGGVASAVIYIEGIKGGKPMAPVAEPERTMDQRNCQYVPHIVVVPVGSAVIFTNGDDAAHNVRAEDPVSGTMLINRAQPVRGRRDSMTVDRSGPISVGCDYHPWMNAYVFGAENPYYAVTDTSGSFVLADVPPGTYKVKMWLNGFRTMPKKDDRGRIIRYAFGEPLVLEQQVTVTSGGAAQVMFQIPAAGDDSQRGQ